MSDDWRNRRHPSRTSWPVCAQTGVVVHAWARQHFVAAPLLQRGGAPDLAGGAQSGGESFQVAPSG
jgi:hypothetical protein